MGHDLASDQPNTFWDELEAAANNNFNETGGSGPVDLSNYLLSAVAASTYLAQADAATNYATLSDISGFLTVTTAASTYATISALSGYLTSSAAASTYATQSSITAAGYLTQGSADSRYLQSTTAASTYLTQANAASTYLTPSVAASTYLTQTNAASTYETSAHASSTYATKSSVSSATSIRGTTGAPATLSTDQNGDFAVDNLSQVLYGPFSSSTGWPTGMPFGPPTHPLNYGWIGWTIDPVTVASNATLVTATLHLVRFTAFASSNVSAVDYFVRTVGATLTATDNWVAIYDTGQASTGKLTLIAQSADQSTNFTAANTQSATFSSGTLTGGSDYFVGFYSCGTTPPILAGAGEASFAPPVTPSGNNNKRIIQFPLAATNTAPATITTSSTVSSGLYISAVVR